MTADKTVSVSFRVTPEFKSLLELAAAHDHRSQTNLLERLLFDYCRMQGISAPVARKPAMHGRRGA